LRAAAYAPFADLLRANMRHAGALRIDHVMALARLWLMPAAAGAADGAYVEYPLDELLGILALESVRAGCLIVGEDLGTVPAGFRERLAEMRILSYRLLQFEVDAEGFAAPSTYPSLALVATGTHDLPPIAAYWTAHDVTLRAGLSLIADHATEHRERDDRARKRDGLLRAFDRELGVDAERTKRFRGAVDDPHASATLAEIALAANRYLAKTPSRLLMVQLEDVLGDARQLNVPTTLDEHPNWRRRAAIALEDLAIDARFVALARALEPERARGNARS
jgi:4-alpha-glucanotransferase